MKNWIIKILSNKFVTRIAGIIALALLAIAPDLDVEMATQVFAQILSGIVLLVAGKFEATPEVKEVKKP